MVVSGARAGDYGGLGGRNNASPSGARGMVGGSVGISMQDLQAYRTQLREGASGRLEFLANSVFLQNKLCLPK